jgi:hypothetical protein
MRRLLVLLLMFSCARESNEPVTIIWDHDKAVAVSVSRDIASTLFVSLKDSQYRVLGNMDIDGSKITFTPAVPFERGQTYEAFSGARSIAVFTIPIDTTLRIPVLTGSFPSCDTVPSNLLKIYLQFSEPMMEGRSSQFVQLYNNVTGDTVKNAFLDLQPELWNDDRTVLTLWLDPGRIKQDLIPNKKLGVVLNDNRTYRLNVAKGWRSQKGVATNSDYTRSFVTTERDVSKPDPKKWSVTAFNDGVFINTNETLDWSLLNSVISIWLGEEEIISKTISKDCERRVTIIPDEPLAPGTYTLMIETRLEDPAGNNINRLFETDVTNKSDNISPAVPAHKETEVYTLTFKIG